MVKAYLLAWIDPNSERVLTVGIYSEHEQLIERQDASVPARLLSCSAADFEQAKRGLLVMIHRGGASYRWVKEYLAETL